VVGTKSGQLVLYDLSNASILETVDAHTGTAWSLHMRPDFGGMVTGSADKDVKFWDFEDKTDPENVRFCCHPF
jgi:U3 small nucleolar RNA-associated protein 12